MSQKCESKVRVEGEGKKNAQIRSQKHSQKSLCQISQKAWSTYAVDFLNDVLDENCGLHSVPLWEKLGTGDMFQKDGCSGSIKLDGLQILCC